MAPEQKQDETKPVGRPTIYTDIVRKPITIQLPVDLIKYIDSVTTNRTKWLIDVIREKMEREQS